MKMTLDFKKAIEAGKKGLYMKETLSITIDGGVKADFINFCKSNNLKYSAILENVIVQLLNENRMKGKNK